MSLTSNSDIAARINESAFNTIFQQFMLQTPETFNYASKKVIDNNRMCSPVNVDPVLDSMGINKITEVPPLPLFGADPLLNIGVEYCVQLKDFKVDFNPTSEIQLPSELGGLAVQQFALKGTVCAGLGSSKIGVRTTKSDSFPFLYMKASRAGTKAKKAAVKKKPTRAQGLSSYTFLPIEYLNMSCFTLSLYAKVVLARERNFLKLKLVGIELEDIAPLGLENSIEYYLMQVLDHVVFPKLKMDISDLAFVKEGYFNIGLTPRSSAVPHNPSITNDYFSLYLNIN